MTKATFCFSLLLLAVLSGCLGPRQFDGEIYNSTDQPQTLHLQVNFSKDAIEWTTLLNKTIDLAANDHHSLGKISDKPGTYEVWAQLENGTQKVGSTGFSSKTGWKGFTVDIRPDELQIRFWHKD